MSTAPRNNTAAASPAPKLDPVLSRVLGRAFEGICEEMGSAMISTAVSAVFVEGRDFSCALLDDRAELVAAANFDPGHLSAMALTAEYALMELGWENLNEGDVIIVNDPYRGGGHLPDICVMRPVFVDGELLCLAMNRGHHIDVGGMSVSGFPGTARSIYQEGLRIPPIKWFERGVERQQVMDLMLLNVRFPREQLGDFRGQLASCMTAEQRMLDIVARYGLSDVVTAMQETKDYSERLMRSAISELPDGTYSFHDVMDDDGLGFGPYKIQISLKVSGDEVSLDFSGTSAQAQGPINSSYGNTLGCVFNGFLHTFGGEFPFNHGCFRPVDVNVPRGCFLNPIPPAPVFGGVTETSIRVVDAVFGALSEVVPDRVCAGGYGTSINVAGGGWDPDRSHPFGFYLFQEGGWGATSWRDGWTAVPNPMSNFNDYPAEVFESTLPMRCVEFALVEDSGGAGEFRGGLGTTRTYEILVDGCELSALGDRFLSPPFGLSGGLPGATARLLLLRAGEESPIPFDVAFGLKSPSKFSSMTVGAGDRIIMITGGGGGYGDPYERTVDRVAADVRNGLVSVESARELDGVALGSCHGELVVDADATAALRAQIRTPPSIEEVVAEVPPGPPAGRAANDIASATELMCQLRSQVADDPCRTSCPKGGDPFRCPVHHSFADAFWDADTLRQWLSRNCVIAHRNARDAALGDAEDAQG